MIQRFIRFLMLLLVAQDEDFESGACPLAASSARASSVAMSIAQASFLTWLYLNHTTVKLH